MATLKDYRKAAAKRQKRYRHKIKEEGLTSFRVDIPVSIKNAIDIECNRTGQTRRELIEQCIEQHLDWKIFTKKFEKWSVDNDTGSIDCKPLDDLLELIGPHYLEHKDVIT